MYIIIIINGNNGCSLASLLKIEDYLGREWSHDNSGVVVSSELHQGEAGLYSRVKNENVSVRMIKTHSNEISIPRGA